MDKLGLNLPLLLFQIINFGILAAVLYSLLYKRVRDMLDERTRRIEQGIQESDQVRKHLAQAKQDYDAEMARARQEAQGILAQARERAKVQEAEILAQARQEGDRLRNEARAQSERERDQLMREVKNEVARIVTMAATKVLRAELTVKGHDKLINEALAELGRRN